MSRRTAVAGLAASSLLLLLTVLALTGVGPSLPGPPVRSWLGVDPELPEPCKPDPNAIRAPAGTPPPGTWRIEPPAPTSSPELGGARVGRFVYLVGGQTAEGAEKTILRFDPRNGAYRRAGRLPVAIDHPAVAAHGEDVIVAGGYIDGTTSTSRTWSYSTRTREVRELPSMQVPRGAAAAAVAGDRLYVAGGLLEFGNSFEPRRSLEIYDFEQREWMPGPAMPTARHHFGAAAVGDKLYFVGGRRPEDLSLAAFEEFDPAAERWRALPSLPHGAGSPGVTAADGQVIVAGGGEDLIEGSKGKWVLRAVYAYDPRMREWSRLPDMRKPRHGLALVAAGGRVFAFRGSPCPGYGRTASAESLDLSHAVESVEPH